MALDRSQDVGGLDVSLRRACVARLAGCLPNGFHLSCSSVASSSRFLPRSHFLSPSSLPRFLLPLSLLSPFSHLPSSSLLPPPFLHSTPAGFGPRRRWPIHPHGAAPPEGNALGIGSVLAFTMWAMRANSGWSIWICGEPTQPRLMARVADLSSPGNKLGSSRWIHTHLCFLRGRSRPALFPVVPLLRDACRSMRSASP